MVRAFKEAKQSTLARIAVHKIVPECRTLNSPPVEEIEIDPKIRDNMSAVLRGLQQVYCSPELRATLFTMLETHFQPGTRKAVGRRAWTCGASPCLQSS